MFIHPKTDTLIHCDVFYPNIRILLHIFETITISSTTAETPFSSLRRLKKYRRSTTMQNGLNSLSVLNTHKEIPMIDINKVINIFS